MRSHYRDGSVAVLDRSQTIRVFDGQGALRWAAGGEGEGPGEFRWAQMVTEIPGDSLLAWDAAAGRLTVFTPDGLLGRLTHSARFRPQEVGRDWVLGVETDPLEVKRIVLYRIRRDP